LKLGYETLLSNFGFNLELRRYSVGAERAARVMADLGRAVQVDRLKIRVDSAYGFSA
jgi:hypothetical protein